ARDPRARGAAPGPAWRRGASCRRGRAAGAAWAGRDDSRARSARRDLRRAPARTAPASSVLYPKFAAFERRYARPAALLLLDVSPGYVSSSRLAGRAHRRSRRDANFGYRTLPAAAGHGVRRERREPQHLVVEGLVRFDDAVPPVVLEDPGLRLASEPSRGLRLAMELLE